MRSARAGAVSAASVMNVNPGTWYFGFRLEKSDLGMRSVFCCLELWMVNSGLGASPAKLLEEFREIRSMDVVLPIKDRAPAQNTAGRRENFLWKESPRAGPQDRKRYKLGLEFEKHVRVGRHRPRRFRNPGLQRVNIRAQS